MVVAVAAPMVVPLVVTARVYSSQNVSRVSPLRLELLAMLPHQQWFV